ncbi:uncharacterized protein LOC142584124 [Dermacentor variabilis]|uniref:uncharacterized protein LOC142584124 n=1 Tax=Dermacentor variabilis TaxID=34621 RepID=UPI003F5BF7D0
MATYNGVLDDLVKCPYNPSHKVKRGRLNIHITKCRREHSRCRLKPCPFTTDHMAPANAEDFQRHLANCPDRSSTFSTATRDEPDPAFDIPVPGGANAFVPEPEEQWDVGPCASNSSGPVNPFQPAVPPIFRTVQGLKPAERKRYYQSLRASGPPVVYVPGQYPEMDMPPMPKTMPKYPIPGFVKIRDQDSNEGERDLAPQLGETRAVEPRATPNQLPQASQFWAAQDRHTPPAPGSTVDVDALVRRLMGLGRARPQPD